MEKDDPRNWDEAKIWESIVDRDFIIQPIYDAELLEGWKDKIGIRKEDYVVMNDAQHITEDSNYDSYDMITYATEHIEYLEEILKRPDIHPMQKKVAKTLKDRLRARINRKKYGSVGWSETLLAVNSGDIDPENLEGNE